MCLIAMFAISRSCFCHAIPWFLALAWIYQVFAMSTMPYLCHWHVSTMSTMCMLCVYHHLPRANHVFTMSPMSLICLCHVYVMCLPRALCLSFAYHVFVISAMSQPCVCHRAVSRNFCFKVPRLWAAECNESLTNGSGRAVYAPPAGSGAVHCSFANSSGTFLTANLCLLKYERGILLITVVWSY